MLFKIGDILKAKELGLSNGNGYGITNNKGLYEVVSAYDDTESINIKVIKHLYPHHIDEIFCVLFKDFELEISQDEDNQI